MSSYVRQPTPPADHFFRVRLMMDGDMQIELRKKLPDGWFRKNRSRKVDEVYILERNLSRNPTDEISRNMNYLIFRHGILRERNGLLGDYPPKSL